LVDSLTTTKGYLDTLVNSDYLTNSFVDTTGSGKISLALEVLSNQWDFYSPLSDSSRYRAGDLVTAIQKVKDQSVPIENSH